MEMPTKAEMVERIAAHRAYRSDSDVVNLLWRGYVTALFEWELLDQQDYRDVIPHLKDVGASETREPMFVFPRDKNNEERLPTLRELRRAVDRSVKMHAGSATIRLLWKGYIAGIAEWTLFFRTDDYHALDRRIGEFAEDERREIFTGVYHLC